MSINLVKPSATLISAWGSERQIAAMTDVLYRGRSPEEALREISDEKVRRRITMFLEQGHHSVFEFMGAQWLVEGSRALTHELIRHRIASYWQESQRYVDYSKHPMRFCVPPGVSVNAEGHAREYLELRRSMAPEDARYALPNAFCSRIWVQMNAREFFLSFMPLRTGTGAFHEIRLIAWLMFSSLIDVFPITSEWVFRSLERLHPDYCREAEKGRCVEKSIAGAFERWGLEIPRKLAMLMEVTRL
ncbi:MAG: FAD-dependent thymidylate synthase [Nitrososphaeria archaeon]